MTQLTPELKAYKEKTVQQLLANFALLEERLETERRVEVADDVRKQLEAIQQHITLLQEELASNNLGEPVADKLYRRIATALTNERFFLAKRLINKLETIEPFYPEIDRLRADAEAKRASRRAQSIAGGGPLPEIVLAPEVAEAASETEQQAVPAAELVIENVLVEPEKSPWYARFFQFHIIVSCLVVLLIACVMFGIGGVSLLQWLVEGG